MKRHNARIISVMTIFNLDMNKELKIDDQENPFINQAILEEKEQDVKAIILDDDYVVEIDDDYINQIINYVGQNYLKIIDIISSSLTNWTIDRLSYADRAIMICACSEMLQNCAPKEVIINEYLEITREYTMTVDEKQVKFNNKALENIARKIYE